MKKYITNLDKISSLNFRDPKSYHQINIRGCATVWFSWSRQGDEGGKSRKGQRPGEERGGPTREATSDLTGALTGRQLDSGQRPPTKGLHSGGKWLRLLLVLSPQTSSLWVLISCSTLVYLSLQVAILMLISSL